MRHVKQEVNNLTFSNKLAVHFWCVLFELWQHDHSFPYILSSYSLKRERSRLSCRCSRNRYPFPLDGSDCRGCELAEGVWSDEHSVTGVDDSAFDDSRHDGPDERDGEGVVDMELERGFCIIVSVMREDVQERTDEIE